MVQCARSSESICRSPTLVCQRPVLQEAPERAAEQIVVALGALRIVALDIEDMPPPDQSLCVAVVRRHRPASTRIAPQQLAQLVALDLAGRRARQIGDRPRSAAAACSAAAPATAARAPQPSRPRRPRRPPARHKARSRPGRCRSRRAPPRSRRPRHGPPAHPRSRTAKSRCPTPAACRRCGRGDDRSPRRRGDIRRRSRTSRPAGTARPAAAAARRASRRPSDSPRRPRASAPRAARAYPAQRPAHRHHRRCEARRSASHGRTSRACGATACCR